MHLHMTVRTLLKYWTTREKCTRLRWTDRHIMLGDVGRNLQLVRVNDIVQVLNPRHRVDLHTKLTLVHTKHYYTHSKQYHYYTHTTLTTTHKEFKPSSLSKISDPFNSHVPNCPWSSCLTLCLIWGAMKVVNHQVMILVHRVGWTM